MRSIGLDVPVGAFHMSLRVRSYEVQRDSRIRLGTLLRYLEHLATEASASLGFDASWYVREGAAWVVRNMDVRLNRLPRVGTELELATWVADFGRVQALRGYAVWEAETGRRVARAQARWAYVDRQRGQPVRLPEMLTTAFRPLGQTMPTHSARPTAAIERDSSHAEALRLTAREYEADSQQHINNCAYADWLWEAAQRTLRASARAPQQTAESAPRSYAIEYIRPALPGDAVLVETRSVAQGSRGYRLLQEIRGARSESESALVRASAECLRVPATRPRG
jgi:acyl-CoA thioesterase FadM